MYLDGIFGFEFKYHYFNTFKFIGHS